MTKKSVRFNDTHIIRYTHSPSDYDRSCFALHATHTIYRPRTVDSSIRKKELSSKTAPSRPFVAPLDLSMLSHHAPKKPKHALRIDTQSVGDGPLFLTGLSTHYRCRSGEDEDNTFLVPMTVRI